MKTSKPTFVFLAVLALTRWAGIPIARAGQVATDGALGARRRLSGPDFSIGPELGQRRGANLFHSLKTLTLDRGESATFTGFGSGAPIKNVFTRVTGGQPSRIDGILRCTIPDANFFLVDSAGVIFGPDAALDVRGSFIITTADEIHLARGGRFAGGGGRGDHTLGSSPAVAFGFLRRAPAGVAIRGSGAAELSPTPGGPGTLTVLPGKAVSIIGGRLVITNGLLRAPSGAVNVIAVGSPGKVTLGAGDAAAIPDVGAAPRLADVQFNGSSALLVDGNGSGRISVRARNFGISGDQGIVLQTAGGGAIDIAASGRVALNGGIIFSNQPGASGVTGDIRIRSRSIDLLEGGEIAVQSTGGTGGNIDLQARGIIHVDGTGLTSTIATLATGGSVGSTHLAASSLILTNGGSVTATATGAKAGGIAVNAGTVILGARGNDTNSSLSAEASGPGARVGAIDLQATLLTIALGSISSTADRGARAGNIDIRVHDLSLRGLPSSGTTTAAIVSRCSGGVRGGNIHIAAGTLRLFDGSIGFTGDGRGASVDISANHLIQDGGAAATSTIMNSYMGVQAPGDLRVHAKTLDLTSGSITSDTGAAGGGSPLEIDANALTLGGGAGEATILSTGEGSGKSGRLTVSASTLKIVGGAIESLASGGGNGGNVSILANTLSVSGGTGHILSQSSAATGGRGGDIDVVAQTLALRSGGRVDAESLESGISGNVRVTSGLVLLDGRDPTGIRAGGLFEAGPSTPNVLVRAATLDIRNGASISTNAFGTADAGGLRVTAQSADLSTGGSITSNSFRGGNAGRVDLDVRGRLTLDSASVAASNFKGAVKGGDVRVNAGKLTLKSGGSIVGTTGGGLQDDLTVTLDLSGQFDSAGISSLDTVAVSLRSPAGTRVSLIQSGQLVGAVFAATLDDQSASLDARPAGFLSTFVAKDLNGLWTLTVRNKPGTSVTLNGFSINYGGRTFQSTDVGQSGSTFTSTVPVRASPGITGGKGGDLRFTARAMELNNGAAISASTTGSGQAGTVVLDAGSFQASGGAVESRSSLPGKGDAGSVSITSSRNLSLNSGSNVAVSAELSAGGSLTLQAGDSINIDRSQVSATARRKGGSVHLISPLIVRLSHGSSIRTESTAQSGGNITIDPLALTLDPTSRISANGGVNGGNITIAATDLEGVRAGGVAGQRNVTATGDTGVSGSINAGPANSDVARSLSHLPADLRAAGLTLEPQCGQFTNVSTFLIQGRGSIPQGPGFWQQETGFEMLVP